MKTFYFVFLSSLAISGHAGEQGSIDSFNGPYIALGVTNFVPNDGLELSSLDNGFTFFRAFDRGNGIGLSLLGGYRCVQEPFVLNGDLVYRYLPGISQAVLLNAINTPKVSSYNNLGLEIRPGVLINPQLAVSAIVGIESSSYRIGHKFNSTKTTLKGLQFGPGLGLGIDVSLSTHLMMQLDYLYIYYNELHALDLNNAAKLSFQPAINLFTLSLNYRFC